MKTGRARRGGQTARRRSSEEIYTSDRICDSYKQAELQTLEAQTHRALSRFLAVRWQKRYRLVINAQPTLFLAASLCRIDSCALVIQVSQPGTRLCFNCVLDSPSKICCCRTSLGQHFPVAAHMKPEKKHPREERVVRRPPQVACCYNYLVRKPGSIVRS